MAQDWSRDWKASSNPQKQRKYRENAPYHIRKKFLSAHLADHIAEMFGTSSLPVRTGDRAEVMRGDWAGMEGTIDRIDYTDYAVYISGIERERVDTSDAKVALDPSNVKLTKLNVDDDMRTKKFDISKEEKSEIEATGEEEAETEDEEEETSEEDNVEDKTEETSEEDNESDKEEETSEEDNVEDKTEEKETDTESDKEEETSEEDNVEDKTEEKETDTESDKEEDEGEN